MDIHEGGDPHQWRVPTDQEKIEIFNHPVVGIIGPGSTSRFVGLDYVDQNPVILDVIYTDNGERLAQVRNIVRDVFAYSDVVRTSLVEFLLNNKYFARIGDHDKKDELDRVSEVEDFLKRREPLEDSLRIDGLEYRSETFELDGYTASGCNVSEARAIVVIGRKDLVSQSTLSTLNTG